MTIFGIEKVLLAYLGKMVNFTKRSAYVTSVVMWGTVLPAVFVPVGKFRCHAAVPGVVISVLFPLVGMFVLGL